MKSVGEQPAFEVNAVFARRVCDPASFSIAGFTPSTRISSSRIEASSGADELNKISLAFDEITEKIRVIGGERANLVDEGLLCLEFLAERKARVVVHEGLRRTAGARSVDAHCVTRDRSTAPSLEAIQLEAGSIYRG